MHGELTYTVSHSVQPEIDGKLTVIGSRHFVIENKSAPSTAEQEATPAEQAQRYNLLYFSIDQQLAGVFCIDAPLRPNARQSAGPAAQRLRHQFLAVQPGRSCGGAASVAEWGGVFVDIVSGSGISNGKRRQ